MASAWAHGHGWARCGELSRASSAQASAAASRPACVTNGTFLFFGKKLWLFIYGLFILLRFKTQAFNPGGSHTLHTDRALRPSCSRYIRARGAGPPEAIDR